MLGRTLVEVFGKCYQIVGLSRHRPPKATVEWCEADLAKPGELFKMTRSVSPDIVIHAAAMTNVDECERDPALAHRVNGESVAELVRYCGERAAKLVHISTDAVFDGTTNADYTEDDKAAPVNAYGLAKLEGERWATQLPQALVLRTNIFGWRHGRGGGLAEWLLSGLREGRAMT